MERGGERLKPCSCPPAITIAFSRSFTVCAAIRTCIFCQDGTDECWLLQTIWFASGRLPPDVAGCPTKKAVWPLLLSIPALELRFPPGRMRFGSCVTGLSQFIKLRICTRSRRRSMPFPCWPVGSMVWPSIPLRCVGQLKSRQRYHRRMSCRAWDRGAPSFDALSRVAALRDDCVNESAQAGQT